MSDIKITHAGTDQTVNRQGPMNPTSQFGQAGAVYTTASADAIKPPTGAVFIAITFILDTVLDDSAGLVAEDADKYFSTEHAAGDLADGSETGIEGSGGLIIGGTTEGDAVTFPKGVTIYGRWTEIDVHTGALIAYIG